jgi:hypothetical protein
MGNNSKVSSSHDVLKLVATKMRKMAGLLQAPGSKIYKFKEETVLTRKHSLTAFHPAQRKHSFTAFVPATSIHH